MFGPEQPEERSEHIISHITAFLLSNKETNQYRSRHQSQKTQQNIPHAAQKKLIKSNGFTKRQINSLLGLHQVIVHEQTTHQHPVTTSVSTLTVHLVTLPLPLVVTTISPSVFALAKPITVHKLTFIEVIICKRISSKTMLFTVSPLSIVNISSLHPQNSFSLLLISDPKSSIIISIVILIFPLAFSQPILPPSFILVLVGVLHISLPIFLIVRPHSSIQSFSSHHLAYVATFVPFPLLNPFFILPS